MLPCASLLVGKEENTNRRRSVESFESDTTVVLRNKRSKPSISVFESTPSPDEENISSRSFGNPSTASVAKDDQYGTIVSVVIVEARDLPNVSSDGSSHRLYCKIRLGSHTLKSKSVTNSQHPIWRERLQFHRCTDNLLKVSLWDKGKQKSFMGSCVLDLSQLEEERTHDVWHTLDDGFGHVHLSMRWYALKDMARRHSAKGNYPRVLLEMSLYWNPMKASLKVFKPKEVKNSHKQVNSKYDISLVYKNLEFIKDALNSILYLDQAYK
ncbi:putative transmembrane 1 protein [Operophtera brumata]|uniref:Putative transmembrane 1 protein n=1 Tax=Operophtera brumata TaxID=104452 RepID=A0A0L7L0R5_OPEBR|nr:putative transmembrane 1 protein [Operophtera brumata]